MGYIKFTSLPGSPGGPCGHWIGHSWRIGALVVGCMNGALADVCGIISKSGGDSE